MVAWRLLGQSACRWHIETLCVVKEGKSSQFFFFYEGIFSKFTMSCGLRPAVLRLGSLGDAAGDGGV